MQAWRLAALPGLLCPSAGQPAFLFIGAAGGLQAAYRKRCLEKQEAFEAQASALEKARAGACRSQALCPPCCSHKRARKGVFTQEPIAGWIDAEGKQMSAANNL
ncbi:hypothetical protein R6Z07F_012827 [Ovis aries]